MQRDEATRSGSEVDWEGARERLGSDATLVGVAQVFLEQLPGLRERVRGGLQGGDASAVREAAHRLKGTLGIFGASGSARTAARLEQEAARGELEPAAHTWRDLGARLDAIELALREQLARLASA